MIDENGSSSGAGNGRPFRILALDGGGIRGAFTAAFLAGLERQLPQPIGEYFDLVAGTSTGGIVAAAIAVGERADRIEEFYRDVGARVFQRREETPASRWSRAWQWVRRLPARACDRALRRWRLDSSWLRQPKYDGMVLRESLEEVFGDRTMEEVRKCRLLISSVDLTRGQTIVFKTPHLPGLVRDRHYRVADVVLATTAAPTYFPHATISEGSAYVDGGLWANNPSMVAIAEAAQIREQCQREGVDPRFDTSSIQLLSIGTGTPQFFAAPPIQGAGVLWWARQLLDLMMIVQAQGVHFQTKYMLGNRYHRIDFVLPNGEWSLDATERLSNLIHLGHEKAVETISSLRSSFFTGCAQPYTPFSDTASQSGSGRGPTSRTQ